MQWEDFLHLHAFLNTERETPIGRGLGLEISDTFFPFTEDPRREFAYFADYHGRLSPQAAPIRELIQAGYIDAMHSYGNFDNRIAFERRMADTAINAFTRAGIKIEVWINHGKVNNVQNIGGFTGYYQQGDFPDSSAYHLDLTVQYGIRFYWNDTILTHLFGVPKQAPIKPPFTRRLLEDRGSDWAVNLLPHEALQRIARQTILRRGLLTVHKLRDGNRLLNFVRFRYKRLLRFAPHARNLQDQLREENLKALIRSGRVAIIYQHLGVYRDGQGKLIPNTLPYFEPPQLERLQRLKTLAQEGVLFITTLSRLLNYIHLTNHLHYTVTHQQRHHRITIHGYICPIKGFQPLTPNALQGVTFYTPDPSTTEIYLEDTLIPTQKNPQDVSGRASVSVKWHRLEYPL